MRRYLLVFVAAAFFMLAPVSHAQADEPFLGQIVMVGFNFAPQGWAMCDGQLMPINQNTALFSLIGTYYGGDGISTFALPDLRGRTPIHQGAGPGLQSYSVGQVGGEEQVSLTISQIPAHTHALLGQSALGSAASPAGNIWAAQSRLNIYSSAVPDVSMAAGSIGTSGAGQPHDNRSPYLTVTYIIALEGVYPSRN